MAVDKLRKSYENYIQLKLKNINSALPTIGLLMWDNIFPDYIVEKSPELDIFLYVLMIFHYRWKINTNRFSTYKVI